MNKDSKLNSIKADFLLILVAAIWGFGFVAQRSGMEFIGPFSFNGIRFVLGSLVLLPFIFFKRIKKSNHNKIDNKCENPSILIKPVISAGCVLFFAVSLQQLGIIFTTAGKAGFITGLYVVITPVLGIFLGRKTCLATWIGCILTFTGLYFISAHDRSFINIGDVLITVSSFLWALHVLLIDRFMQRQDKPVIDPIKLSCGQFAVAGVLSLLCAICIEPHIYQIIERYAPSLLNEGLFAWRPFFHSVPVQAFIPIFYGGAISVGIAYTLQVVAQRHAPPAHAVIILCFEGCFAVLGGILILGEKLDFFTLIGCAFMLTGMLVSQLGLR